MEHKKAAMFILRLAIGVIIALLIWKPLVGIAFWLTQGPDARYNLGGNYEMLGPRPCVLVYWPSEEEPFERVISEPVLKFALSGPWIIGRTEKSWFGINKESHDVHYPHSKVQLQTATGLDLSSLKMETDPTPYLIVRPKALTAKSNANRLCWLLLFLVPIILAFGPLLIPKRSK